MIVLSGLSAYITVISTFGVLAGIGLITIPIEDEQVRSWIAALSGMVITFTIINMLEKGKILEVR